MRARWFLLLPALALAACVVPVDAVRLASRGPTIEHDVTIIGRPLAAGERIALMIRETQLDPARLQRCIAEGMRTRLPSPGPEVVALDEAAARRLVAALPADPQAALPLAADEVGAEWALVVRDTSRRAARPESGVAAAGAMMAAVVGEHADYALALEAAMLDLRARRPLGRATASYAASGGSGIAVGIALAAGIPVPIVLPLVAPPAGTSALTICDAFGRSLAEALLVATGTPTGAAPAAAR